MVNPDEKLRVYSEALEDVIKKLTLRRSELAALAHQTVEHLEASIPILRKRVDELQKINTDLDKVIEDKRVKASVKERDLKAEYDSLRVSLEANYQVKLDEVSARDKIQDERDESYGLRLSELIARESAISNGNAIVASGKSALEKERKEFESYRDKEIRLTEKSKNDAQDYLLATKKNKEQLVIELKELENGRDKLKDDQRKADEILIRIGEASEILKKARIKEDEVVVRQGELNEQLVKNMSDVRRNNIRTTELDSREQRLNERENNLRLLEAQIAKG